MGMYQMGNSKLSNKIFFEVAKVIHRKNMKHNSTHLKAPVALLSLIAMALVVPGCGVRQAVITEGQHLSMRIDKVDGRVLHVSVFDPATNSMKPLDEAIHVTGQLEGWTLSRPK